MKKPDVKFEWRGWSVRAVWIEDFEYWLVRAEERLTRFFHGNPPENWDVKEWVEKEMEVFNDLPNQGMGKGQRESIRDFVIGYLERNSSHCGIFDKAREHGVIDNNAPSDKTAYIHGLVDGFEAAEYARRRALLHGI